jgi:CRP-like cAMP-binding protein
VSLPWSNERNNFRGYELLINYRIIGWLMEDGAMRNLASNRLFAGLKKEETSSIAACAKTRRYKSPDIIIREDNPATRLFIVKSGLVNFYTVTEKGQKILLRRFVPGGVFGIAAFLWEPMGYLGTAVALDDTEVATWEHQDVLRFADAYPRFSQNAFRLALSYIAEYARRHVSLATDTAQERAAYVLTHNAAQSGRVLPDGVSIDIRNEDLADLADISFFTVSRLLQKWERTGAVVKSRGRVLIRCPEKLLAAEASS